jgi:hypothetical protein
MSIVQYAQYSSAFAFQTFLTAIVDLGFSRCIVALVGERGHDREVVGGYIKSSRHARFRMFLFFSVASGIAFPLVTIHQAWSVQVKALLWVSIVASVLLQGQMLYSAPLLIHKKMGAYYGASLAQSGLRLVLVSLLHFIGGLFSWSVAWVGSLTLAVQGFLYRRAAKDLVTEPKTVDPELLKEMRRYLAPLWPGMLYYAFQGQLTVGLITLFGKTQSIAEVAALGRLGQLFMLLNAVNGVLIEPHIAKTPARRLFGRYTLVAAAAAAICAILWLVAVFAPGPFMWLVGEKYARLQPLMPMLIVSAGISYVGGVLFTMNAARKWVWWHASVICTASIVIADFSQIAFTNLSTTASMIRFTMVTSTTGMIAIAGTGIYGLWHTNRGVRTAAAKLEPAVNHSEGGA